MTGLRDRLGHEPKEKHLHQLPTVTLHIGDVHASTSPVKIKTVLGSCIAACLYDPATGIGGMNHFLLPGESQEDPELSTRYGVNAMEVLINEMMRFGARRHSMRAKVFGGGQLFRSSNPFLNVGRKNIGFILGFLETESIPVASSRLGGNEGLVVIYLPHTFEVFVKPLSVERFLTTEEKELVYQEELTAKLNRRQADAVTLF